jgi:hypothetical protein
MSAPADPPHPLLRFGLRTFLLLAGLTAAGLLIHGYHYGFDDQSVYLPAIKKRLQPDLYPFDADFFLLQTRLGSFADAVAGSVRLTRLPVDWAIFFWYLATVYLLLAGCWRIARQMLRSSAGIQGALLLTTALLTLPVAGTFIVLCDPYLHPRALAMAFLLFALADLWEGRLRIAVWALLAALAHPTIALFGFWHIAVQAWPAEKGKTPALVALAALAPAALFLLPGQVLAQWFADPASPAWREALSGRRYLFPQQWTWYELLGAFAPLLILEACARHAQRRGLERLGRICRRLILSGGVGIGAGFLIGLSPALLPLVPLEPMRTLALVYLLMVVFVGGLVAERLPAKSARLAPALLVPLALGMFFVQRAQLEASPHIEWPGVSPKTDWLQAFDWIRRNSPRDALFAMNPDLLQLPGENEHGFRALAERSQLAEASKDRAVSRNIPSLAWQWRDQVRAQRGIEDFDRARLQNLGKSYGATWIVLRTQAGRAAALPGLCCPYENATVRVCRMP